MQKKILTSMRDSKLSQTSNKAKAKETGRSVSQMLQMTNQTTPHNKMVQKGMAQMTFYHRHNKSILEERVTLTNS